MKTATASLLGFFSVLSVACAEPNLRLGPVNVHPHLDVAATYDDNIFISHSKENADFYFTVSPGIGLQYGVEDHHSISVDYTAGIQRFVRFTEEDTVNHTATLRSQFEFAKTTLALSHTFTDLTATDVEVGTRIKQQKNISAASVEYRFSPKTSASVNYQQEFYDFQSGDEADYQTYRAGSTFYYRVTPKTDILAEYAHGWVEMQSAGSKSKGTKVSGQDAQFDEVYIGTRVLPASKLVGTAKIGYQHRSFTNPDESRDILLASTSMTMNFTDRTSVELMITRTENPSVTSSDNSYTLTRAGLTLRQDFLRKKLVVAVGGSYERDDFQDKIVTASGSTSERTDNYWEASLAADYSFTEWFSVGALYRFRRNDSTVGRYSFDNNITTIHASLHF